MKKKILSCLVLSIFLIPQIGLASNDEELKLGFFADRREVSTKTLLLNDAVNQRIAEIGNRVAKASDKPGIKYVFRIINDPVINASSAAGGFIYINTGLLDVLESEDELAAVIAHEIAHVDKSHQINHVYAVHRSIVTGQVAGVLIGVAFAAAGVAAMGTAPSVYSPSYSMYSSMTNQVAQLGLRLGGVMGDAMAVSMAEGYGKEQELEADSLSIQYTKNANYDPNALVGVFKKLQSVKTKMGINDKNYVSALLNAKPGLDERIKQAETLISNAGEQQGR
jgi:predicted Zn-dependent protease